MRRAPPHIFLQADQGAARLAEPSRYSALARGPRGLPSLRRPLLLGPDFFDRFAQNPEHPLPFLGRRINLFDDRRLQFVTQLAKFLLGLAPLGLDSGPACAAGVLALFVFFGVALLEVGHLLAEPRQLIQSLFHTRAIFLQMLGARFGDLVELLGPFRFRSGVAHFFQVGQRRINHARTRRVDAAGMFFDLFDDLVAVARFLAQQRQDDQLQITGSQHFRGAHSWTAGETGSEAAEKSTSPETMSASTFKTGVVMTPIVMHVVNLLLVVVQHLLRCIVRYIVCQYKCVTPFFCYMQSLEFLLPQ